MRLVAESPFYSSLWLTIQSWMLYFFSLFCSVFSWIIANLRYEWMFLLLYAEHRTACVGHVKVTSHKNSYQICNRLLPIIIFHSLMNFSMFKLGKYIFPEFLCDETYSRNWFVSKPNSVLTFNDTLKYAYDQRVLRMILTSVKAISDHLKLNST